MYFIDSATRRIRTTGHSAGQVVGVGLALYKRLLNRESRVVECSVSLSWLPNPPSFQYLFNRWSLIAQPGLWSADAAHRFLSLGHFLHRARARTQTHGPACVLQVKVVCTGPLRAALSTSPHATKSRHCLLPVFTAAGEVTWRHNNAPHLCCSLFPSCIRLHVFMSQVFL